MDDQIIKLILQISGTADVGELKDKLEAVGTAGTQAAAGVTKVEAATAGPAIDRATQNIYEFADAYEVLGIEQTSVFTSAAQVGAGMAAMKRQMDPVEFALADLGTKAERAARGVKGVAAGSTSAATGMSAWQQRIAAGSYAFQDFTATSGDLGAKLNSISNNIPMLLAGMGGLATGVSIAATAGIALYRNWDTLASFWETRNPFPKGARDIEGMKDELQAAKDRMEEFEKAGTGTAEQIAKYNELRARTAQLEKEIADQQDRQARLKKILEAPSEEDEGRAKAFREATKGRGQEYLDKTEQAMRADAEEQIAREEGRMNRRVAAFNRTEDDPDRRNAFLLEQSRAFQDFAAGMRKNDFHAQAEDLFVRLDKGDATANKILERLSNGYGVNFDGLLGRMDEANPQKKAERKEAEDARKKAADEQKKADEEQAKLDKLQDEAEDREEERGVKEAQRIQKEQEKARKEAARKAGKADKDDVAGLEAEAKRNEGAIDAEVKKITDTVGKGFQQRYEMALANNASNAAQGLPSMDPARLKAQLQNEMFAMMRRRGAGEQSARLATGAISKAGDQDLTQRMTEFGGHGLNLAAQTLMLTRQLRSELDHMDAVQKQLIAEARNQARMSRPNARTNAKH